MYRLFSFLVGVFACIVLPCGVAATALYAYKANESFKAQQAPALFVYDLSGFKGKVVAADYVRMPKNNYRSCDFEFINGEDSMIVFSVWENNYGRVSGMRLDAWKQDPKMPSIFQWSCLEKTAKEMWPDCPLAHVDRAVFSPEKKCLEVYADLLGIDRNRAFIVGSVAIVVQLLILCLLWRYWPRGDYSC